MSEKIEDKNLSRIIKIKMRTNSINTIEEIEDIYIQNINLMEHKLNIDLTEITKLKNLKSISLRFFEITDEVIKAIKQLEYLQKIEFSMCAFKNNEEFPEKVKSITIYNCQGFNDNMISKKTRLEKLQLVHSGLVNVSNISNFKELKLLKISHCSVISIPHLSELEQLEKLYLNHLEIPYDIEVSKMPNLKFISLSGSNVSDREKYIENLRKQNEKLIIEFKENDLPID